MPVQNVVDINAFSSKLKVNLVRWVRPGWQGNLGLIQAVTAGRIYFIPIFVEEDTTYIGIGAWVGTLSAGTADLRIFKWNNGLPGALILSAGTINTGSTGEKSIVISQKLTRGYYFLAIRCSATPSMFGMDPTSCVQAPVSGIGLNAGGNMPGVVLSVLAAYANPAPAPTDYNSSAYANVALREN